MKNFNYLSLTAVVLLGTVAVIFPEMALATEAALKTGGGGRQ